jgi:hypothetical protein
MVWSPWLSVLPHNTQSQFGSILYLCPLVQVRVPEVLLVFRVLVVFLGIPPRFKISRNEVRGLDALIRRTKLEGATCHYMLYSPFRRERPELARAQFDFILSGRRTVGC